MGAMETGGHGLQCLLFPEENENFGEKKPRISSIFIAVVCAVRRGLNRNGQ